jgi:hypothetical protein
MRASAGNGVSRCAATSLPGPDNSAALARRRRAATTADLQARRQARLFATLWRAMSRKTLAFSRKPAPPFCQHESSRFIEVTQAMRIAFRGSVRRQREARVTRFQQVILAAKEQAALNPHSLPSLARALARPLQARRLTLALQTELHGAPDNSDFDHLFFPEFAPITLDGRSLFDLTRDQDQQSLFRLDLARDIVIPAAWHRDRLIDALAYIGSSKSAGPWRPDPNHSVALVLPFGLGRVHGGNHSIAAGIADGEGWVPAIAHDLSVSYEHIRYDGLGFVRLHDGHVLSTPREEEPGLLFELGRLMIDLGVEYDARPISSEDKLSAMADDRYAGTYQVWINGRDTGDSVQAAAIEKAMHDLGIARSEPRWEDVLREEASITPKGMACSMSFKFVAPRPRLSDVTHAR